MAAGLLLVLLLTLSSSGNDLGGTYKLWKPKFWGPRLARADDGASPFLASQLPLKPLVTTPVDILQASSTPVPVGGRQALTVVFSRPVIALGADFGTADAFAGKAPFNVTCATSTVPAGKSRWVTTTIARFDPDQDWPTDLDCSFIFNTDLTSYDGVKVDVPKAGSVRRLTSSPLFAYVSTVLSERASNASGGSWSPTLAGSPDTTPEVPPDGEVVVYFNFPVNRTLLAASLQLKPNPDNLKLNLSRCQSTWAPGPDPASATANDPAAALDEACVSITFSGALRDETKYQLVLPSGTRYSVLAGVTRKVLSLPLTGLRAFTLPIRQNFQMPKNGELDNLWDGTRYKRLVLWLPRGLAKGTTAQQVAQQVTVSRVVPGGLEALAITSAKLVAPSHLQLQLDALQPRTKYRAAVAASDAILDAFGRPLKASSGDFWSLPLQPFVAPPNAVSSPVVHFAPDDLPSEWPIATLGSDGLNVRAGVWTVDASTDKGRSNLVALLSNNGNVLVEDVLGKPVAQVPLGNSSLPTQVALPLDAAQDVQLVATCCSTTYYPRTRNVSSSLQLVVKTTLLTSWVLVPGQQVAVWVTSSDPSSPGPVQGARAFLYQINYDSAAGNTADLLGSCVTGPNGFCTLPTPTPPQDTSLNLVGLVRGPKGKGGVAYTPTVGYWNALYPTAYSGALVLDRALVRPGETLHVSGYVAQKLPPGGSSSWPLGAPNVTLAQLTVYPSWFSNATQNTLLVPVAASYGTLQANISVPADATAGSYSIRLEVSPDDDFPGSAAAATSTGSAASRAAAGRRLRGDQTAAVAVHHAATTASAAAVYPVRGHDHSHGHSHGAHLEHNWLHAAPWRRALKQATGPEDTGGSSGGRAPVTYLIAYEALTVSDPRPPTADLTITAPPWAKPTAAVKVSLQATSYLGSQVSNASINVVWQTDLAKGLVVATTDANGAASAAIPLDTLPAANVSSPGATLSVTAEWVGPTRERIVRTASVTLDSADRRISIARTFDTDAPGLPWGVQVDIVSNVDGSSFNGVPVLVTLMPNATAGALCNTTSSCEVLSGDVASGAKCQLSLPCVGEFIIGACTTTDPTICTNTTIGKNETEWQQLPYSAFGEPQLLADKAKYSIGETATLWFQNPWSPEATALVLWGNQDSAKLKSTYLGKVPVGAFKVEVPLGAESKGGTGVAVLLSVPRGEGVLDLPQGLFVSKLFNPLGPHTHALITSLTIAAPTALTVAIDVAASANTTVNGVPVPVLAPGDNVTVTVAVREDDGAFVPDAEVTLLAVDKALLDLLPYELKDLTAALALPLASQPSVADLDTTLIASGALEAVYAAIKRRLAADPWVPADTTIVPLVDQTGRGGGPRSYLAAVDVSDETYLDQFTTPITYGPAKSTGLCELGAPCFSDSAMPPMFDAAAGGNEASSPAAPTPPSGVSKSGDSGGTVSRQQNKASSSPRLTTAFASTPLFTVFRTTTDGSGSTTFTAPQNLGTFIFRAFVVAKGVAHLGSNQTSVVVRRPLSLTASLPRIVRLGDTFLAGVLVTSPGLAANAPSFTITVTVKVLTPVGPVVLSAPLNASSTTLSGAKPQAEVRFNFTAAALGDASFEFTVTDESGASDALVASTPVLPQQSPVFVATSFALRGNASAAAGNSSSVGWQEGLALPEAAPGSGSLDLLAGVGYLPAILASTDAIAKQRATLKVAAGNLDAYASLALASVAPILSTYSQQLSETQLSNATDAVQTLVDLTQYDFGLLPSKPSTWSWTPTRADILLNLQASFLVADLPTKFGGPIQGAWDSLRGVAVPQWKRSAAAQIVSDATLSRNPPSGNKPVPYQDYLSLAWARLALGVAWSIPECFTPEADLAGGVCTSDANVRKDLSLETLIAAAPEAGFEVYVLTALALQASSTASNYASFISKAADLALGNVRVQGRTAYVAAYSGARDAAPLETQALALRLLSALGRAADAPLVQKLAAYLAAAGTSGGAGALAGILPPVTPSAWVTALSAATLSKYDQKAGSTAPDLSLLATVDSAVVLKATFNKSTLGAAPATSSTPWDDLASPPGPLQFNATGKGEVSVSVGLSFVPLKPLSFPSYRGIWVASVVQLSDPTTGLPTGPPLAQVPLGSVVTVTVQVTSPDDLGAVTIEALSPGGLEPLDPALTSGQGTASASGALCPLAAWAGDAYGAAYWRWWWPICPSQSVTPRAVTWKYQRLMAGTQALTFSAVAATEGAFVLPPIQASADDQPEVRGSTAAGTLTVGPAGSSPVPVAGSESGTPPAKGCPKDCNGHGACNTGTGECVCSVGWKGVACDQPTAT